jgi:RimJ/RimL family protein N-acetyltransferase
MRNEIETERLVLRQTKQSDAAAFSKLVSDFDIARMTGSIAYPYPVLSAEFKIMTFHSAKRRGLAHPYAITLKTDDKLIGIADLFKRSEDALWEIGYWIGRPFWGQGYITEACSALLCEADETLGRADRIAGVFTDNPGSARVLEKLGFERSGEPEYYFSMGRLKKALSQDFIRKAVL